MRIFLFLPTNRFWHLSSHQLVLLCMPRIYSHFMLIISFPTFVCNPVYLFCQPTTVLFPSCLHCFFDMTIYCNSSLKLSSNQYLYPAVGYFVSKNHGIHGANFLAAHRALNWVVHLPKDLSRQAEKFPFNHCGLSAAVFGGYCDQWVHIQYFHQTVLQ